MAERLKAHAWKACKEETLSRVRIPLSPPTISKNFKKFIFKLIFCPVIRGYS